MYYSDCMPTRIKKFAEKKARKKWRLNVNKNTRERVYVHVYFSVVLNICFTVDSSPETQTSLQSVVQFYMDAAESYSKVPSTLLAYMYILKQPISLNH